jgi:hypothetical protein
MISKPRLLRSLFWIVSVLMTAFVVGGFLLPRDLTITRSVTIRATPMEVYDQFQSFKNWETWGPWFQRDPFLEKKFEGEPGLGALMSWKSRSEGEGRVKIVSARTGQSLRMAVDYGSNGSADLSIDLDEKSEGVTEVKWGFHTDFGQNMAKRYFGLYFAGTVKDDLEEALSNLKSKLENPPAPPRKTPAETPP